MLPTTPPIAELAAPANWRVVDFISDLHLQASEPRTLRLWERYMARTEADAVFILGDLFEAWIGDDALSATRADASTPKPSFEDHCAHSLKEASRHRAIFFMRGNRDFLLGAACAQACGMQLLADPTVLAFAGQRWLLTHGDALCLDDTQYLQFRAQVRGSQWQQDFLAKPLAERRAIAQALRKQSEARKRSGALHGDVDTAAARHWLAAASARELIHGHTHRPADHDLGQGCVRHVLTDWDGAAMPVRAQVLRLRLGSSDDGVALQRLDPLHAS